MSQTDYILSFHESDKPIKITVEHDPEETGIDVEAEFDRYCEIGHLESGGFRSNVKDFGNFLWSQLGLVLLASATATDDNLKAKSTTEAPSECPSPAQDGLEPREFSVDWSKTYVRRGTESVVATSKEEAEDFILERVGDLEGSSDYLPDQDYVSAR